ncbi:hypothetical protein T05_1305 [Trichinella murrelli]|uniref:Uncharacterized protein n=1 Tax=Trichinella murrelli TaxID=144512 RepID=A0A0V0T9J4_9BILA|nr:hypothetical protein T05_1305 [Trichinella murrelli]
MHLLIFDQLLKIFQNAENDKQYFDLIYFKNQQNAYQCYQCFLIIALLVVQLLEPRFLGTKKL